MTVIELIDKLAEFPAGARVYVGKGMGELEGVDVAASDPELIILRPERFS
jgi:hypothetical protein